MRRRFADTGGPISEPCRPGSMQGIKRSGSSNPVVVLDEVDKLSKDYSGDPASALLEVLDPEQNNTFTDHYLNVPYDSFNMFCLFVRRNKVTDTIPEPLLNRMEVISFSGYTEVEKLQIAKRHLIPKAEKAMGIPAEKLEIPEEVLRQIITEYTMESGVRGLKKQIDAMCRALPSGSGKIRREASASRGDLHYTCLEESSCIMT